MYPKNHVFQYPSGKWGFVGRVDCRLTWQNKDGTPLTAADATRLVRLSNPGMAYKVKVYNSRQDAIDAANVLGVEITE